MLLLTAGSKALRAYSGHNDHFCLTRGVCAGGLVALPCADGEEGSTEGKGASTAGCTAKAESKPQRKSVTDKPVVKTEASKKRRLFYDAVYKTLFGWMDPKVKINGKKLVGTSAVIWRFMVRYVCSLGNTWQCKLHHCIQYSGGCMPAAACWHVNACSTCACTYSTCLTYMCMLAPVDGLPL